MPLETLETIILKKKINIEYKLLQKICLLMLRLLHYFLCQELLSALC